MTAAFPARASVKMDKAAIESSLRGLGAKVSALFDGGSSKSGMEDAHLREKKKLDDPPKRTIIKSQGEAVTRVCFGLTFTTLCLYFLFFVVAAEVVHIAVSARGVWNHVETRTRDSDKLINSDHCANPAERSEYCSDAWAWRNTDHATYVFDEVAKTHLAHFSFLSDWCSHGACYAAASSLFSVVFYSMYTAIGVLVFIAVVACVLICTRVMSPVYDAIGVLRLGGSMPRTQKESDEASEVLEHSTPHRPPPPGAQVTSYRNPHLLKTSSRPAPETSHV